MDNSELIRRIEEVVSEMLLSSPACHDWEHTCRVRDNAMHIAREEGADLLVVELAALLHDIGRPAELTDHGKTDHAVLGAAMARSILKEYACSNELIEKVSQCVKTHRYRKRSLEGIPSSLEAKCVFDADKLDSIGAIGIGRAFHFAGRTGAKIHNTEEEALSSESYSREDTAYREYLVKLRHVKDNMLTDAGRNMAHQRHDFMAAFFDELNAETFNDEEQDF